MKANFYLKALVSLIVFSTFFMANIQAQEHPFAGGKGTSSDPYQIETPEQFDAIRDYRDKRFILNADLDFANYMHGEDGVWWPIGEWGSGDNAAERFSGTFNGNGHTIKNLSVERVAHDLSIFGVTDGAKITKLIIENCEIIGEGRLGVLTGACFRTELNEVAVINSKCLNTLSDHGSHAGGITGPSFGSTISNCYSLGGTVYGKDGVGGICSGFDSNTTLFNCYSDCSIEGYTSVGGLSGHAHNGAIINCIALNREILAHESSFNRLIGGYGGMTLEDNYAKADLTINGNIVDVDLGLTTANGENASAEEIVSFDFYKTKLKFDDSVWKMNSDISPYPVFVWQKGNGTGISKVENKKYTYSVLGGQLTIRGLEGNEQINVYNTAGTLVSKVVASSTDEVVRLNNSGIYIVTVNSVSGSSVFKILN